MNHTIRSYASAATAAVALALVAGAAAPAFAVGLGTGLGVNASATATASTSAGQVGVGARTGVHMSASLSARGKNAVNHANEEITRRLDALNALAARVNAMVRLSATEKSDLSASIQSQIGDLQTLQSQIAADAAANNTSSMKTAIQSIVNGYRIYILVLPQGAIEAASDRVLTITGIMQDLSTKLSARITAAAAVSGNDVTAAQASLADMNAKVADANTQATAAANEVAGLKPDNGDATIQASNTAALKDAHAKIKAAQQDLIAARADAMAIVKDFGAFKTSANANASATASTSGQ